MYLLNSSNEEQQGNTGFRIKNILSVLHYQT